MGGEILLRQVVPRRRGQYGAGRNRSESPPPASPLSASQFRHCQREACSRITEKGSLTRFFGFLPVAAAAILARNEGSMNRRSRNGYRVRLDPDDYRELAKHVLERDGWQCQYCGRRDQLQIHHLVLRSQLGADCEENLIVLCNQCHRSLHSAGRADSDGQV